MARDAQRPSYGFVIVDPPAFGVGRGKLRVLRLLRPEIFANLRSLRPSHVLLTRNGKVLCGLLLRPYAPVDRLG